MAKFDCMDPFVMFHRKLVSNLRASFLTEWFFFGLGIFSSSIKENILFGEPYHLDVFHRVIQVTALDTVCEINTYFIYGFDYLTGF